MEIICQRTVQRLFWAHMIGQWVHNEIELDAAVEKNLERRPAREVDSKLQAVWAINLFSIS